MKTQQIKKQILGFALFGTLTFQAKKKITLDAVIANLFGERKMKLFCGTPNAAK